MGIIWIDGASIQAGFNLKKKTRPSRTWIQAQTSLMNAVERDGQ